MPKEATLQWAGLVLAGGQSRRMGTDKAGLRLGGETLLARALRVLRPFVSDLAVAARPGQTLEGLPPDAVVLRDSVADQGPLRGLADGLRIFQGRAAGLLLVPVDGLIEADLLGRLVAAFASGEADAAVPGWQGERLPLPGAYSAALQAKAEQLLKGPRRGLKHLLEECRTTLVPLSAAEAEFLSLDTPEAFAKAEAQFREATGSRGTSA